MADHANSKEGQALANKLAELSSNMRQAANLADAFAQSLAQMFPGITIPPSAAAGTGKKRGRVPKEGKRVKDPNAPKRPPTSYIMFQNDVRDELRQKHPGLPYKELLGKVSEAWQALAEEQKRQYQDAADSRMAKYNSAVINYKEAANGHAPAVVAASVAPTPEVDDEDDDEEDEEETLPAPKKVKTAAPGPVVESSDESDVPDTDSEPVLLPPVKKTKAPPSAGKEKEKKKAKK